MDQSKTPRGRLQVPAPSRGGRQAVPKPRVLPRDDKAREERHGCIAGQGEEAHVSLSPSGRGGAARSPRTPPRASRPTSRRFPFLLGSAAGSPGASWRRVGWAAAPRRARARAGESRFGARGPAARWRAVRVPRFQERVRSGPGGPKPQVYPANAARERSRVRNLRQAFHSLQAALPSVPPNTKLSKLDVLVLATNYIAHLTQTLDQGETPTERPPLCRAGGYLHPVKKWPMRSLLYCGSVGELLSGAPANQNAPSGEDDANPPAPDGEGHTDWSGQK
ncbi:hypothetical protein ANANG_G00116210 [Anguilla anguilla]|uniref:BHLH domain-containing protein n=1 Tax=Anguilla anguilla TaxID=7936 RepID=A0A9D3S161_ANGAN|nr:hypothetical protein ANANG_G00116210 [Anguilla anguilla]